MALPKEYGKWHKGYMKFNRWSKNGTIAKAIAFFFNLVSAAMRKQKLFNKGNYVFFIDSASIKVNTDANRSRNTQE